ncbi:MAG TPA: chemotaxis protein CheB [Gaiellaceae bacterium]|nr:chemotaxis protein CheB [Gaiellaceae bacterium]
MSEAAPGRRPRVVVIGASAGGVEALRRLVAGLPADFSLPIVVVLHVPPTSSVLPEILTRAGRLPAEHATDNEPLTAGRIHVAPPDCHVVVADGALRVGGGPKENGHRPAVDPLFRTAATELGPGVVGVVLSGSLDDGTSGLHHIKRRGGVTIVQDPREALYPAMPTSARDAVGPDHVLPVADIAQLLVRIASSPPEPYSSPSNDDGRAMEGDSTQLPPVAVTEANREVGRLTAFTCPECSGTLWEIEEGGLVKLRCRVGHAYTEDGYAHEKGVHLEAALWTAITALVERADFARRLARRFRRGGQQVSAKRYDDQAAHLLTQADALRAALIQIETPEAEEQAAS